MEELSPQEVTWRDHYTFLLEKGYQLRSRYHPDWQPSWAKKKNADSFQYEDGQYPLRAVVNHAVRVQDLRPVVLKRVNSAKYPHEVDVLTHLNKDPLLSDPRNHAVPLLDTIYLPESDDIAIIVMPLLRSHRSPEFDTIGEALEFVRQFIEGISFLHQHRIAHLDLSETNVMMDGQQLYPEGFHPVNQVMNSTFTGKAAMKYTRTEKPPKYYIIDFGLSQQFENPLAPVPEGGSDMDARPESERRRYARDISEAGLSLQMLFLDGDYKLHTWHGRYGFEFLRPLILEMTEKEWTKRPTAKELETRFQAMLKTLPTSQLRSQCIPVPDPDMVQPPSIWVATGKIGYWFRRLRYMVTRTPALPSLK